MSELKLDEVRVIKITTGEVVMGFNYTSEDLHENPELDNYIIVRHPYQVEYNVRETDEGQGFYVNCYRWMPFIEDEALLIQKHNIIAIGIPDEDLLSCYTDLLQASIFGLVGEEDGN